MIKIDVLIGMAAGAVTLLAFFARAYANYRAGKRVRGHAASIVKDADREVERLRAEIDGARRTVGQDRPNRKE